MILYNATGSALDLNIYLEWQNAHHVNRPFNALIAFQYLQDSYSHFKKLREDGRISNLFLDAGTFQLNEAKRSRGPGRKPRFLEYVQFVAMYHSIFDRIAAYDQDFDHVDVNQDLLDAFERRLSQSMDGATIKQKLVPVIHGEGAEAIDELKQYRDDGYKCVAIGSSPEVPDDIWATLKQVATEDSINRVELHHFGSLDAGMLRERRPDSADSTGFLKAGAFDSVYWWDASEIDPKKRWKKFRIMRPTKEYREGITTSRLQFPPDFLSFLLREFGTTEIEILGNKSLLAAVNLHAIIQLEDWLNSTSSQTANESGESSSAPLP